MFNRKKSFAALRVAFGFVWAVDACFKWNPAFLNGFGDMVSSMGSGEPSVVSHWINIWSGMVAVDPHFFAVTVAVIETALAVGLIFDLFPKTVYISGFLFSLIVWSVGEAFGGPYSAASTDIGAAILYAFVFAALYFEKFGSENPEVDPKASPKADPKTGA